MMRPILHAANFPSAHTVRSMYDRLERVLVHSAAVHCPGWQVTVDHDAPVPCRSALHIRSHEFNTQKDDSWCRAVVAAPDGAQLLLIDIDTVIVRPLDVIWDQAFDVAYTRRADDRPAGPPFNSGVLFVRVSPGVRAFFQAWNRETHRLLANPQAHEPLRRVYTGIHQSALGALLEAGAAAAVDLRPIACDEWNCDPAFDRFDETTRILHVKSGLRRAVFFGNPGHRELAALWKRIEREAEQAVRA